MTSFCIFVLTRIPGGKVWTPAGSRHSPLSSRVPAAAAADPAEPEPPVPISSLSRSSSSRSSCTEKSPSAAPPLPPLPLATLPPPLPPSTPPASADSDHSGTASLICPTMLSTSFCEQSSPSHVHRDPATMIPSQPVGFHSSPASPPSFTGTIGMPDCFANLSSRRHCGHQNSRHVRRKRL